MLDANPIIALLSGGSAALFERVSGQEEGALVTSAIAFGEVALGSWQGRRPSLEVLDRFATRVPVLPFDDLAARQYAQLPLRPGSYDRLIAAHALSLGLTLVTNNERDFADIPGLRVENWTR